MSECKFLHIERKTGYISTAFLVSAKQCVFQNYQESHVCLVCIVPSKQRNTIADVCQAGVAAGIVTEDRMDISCRSLDAK